MAQNNSIDELNKNWGPTRILNLKAMPGKDVLDVTGTLDKRLFSGENKLYAFQEDGCLWRLRFEHGVLPGPLKGQFTGFTVLLKTVEDYYARRNVEVFEVKG